MLSVDIVAIVLVLAALIGAINDRFVHLPAPISMLLGSLAIVVVLAGADRALHLHIMAPIREALFSADLPDIFLGWVLALLLFAGCLHVDLPALRRHVGLITMLATAGVVISTAVFCLGLWMLFVATGIRVPIGWCFVLGAILAPTDAVVAEALLRHSSMPAATRAAIVGESLFNDGAGVVLFVVALRVAQGETGLIGHGRLGLAMAEELIGGALLGCACGALAGWTMRRVADDAVNLMISLALVVGCYRLAGACEVSGPVAVVSGGLLLSYLLHSDIVEDTLSNAGAGDTQPGRIVAFWSLLDRILNLGLFLLIGVQVLALVVNGRQVAVAMIAVPLSLLARAVSVAVPLALSRPDVRTVARQTTVLTWAGMRGGVSIALALTMPTTVFRGQLLVICYGVVLFSIVVQGLTLPALLGRLYGGSAPPGAPEAAPFADLPG